jgi:hypothetical protein
MLINILFVLVIIAYIVANVIMTIISIQSDNTIKDILDEQDFGLGKVGVILMYWPAFVILYIRSLRPINTKSCFDEEDFLEVK